MRIKRRLVIFFVLVSVLTATAAMADYKALSTPKYSVYDMGDIEYGYTIQRLALNAGPGTRRYYKELGGYGSSGEWVKIVAKAYDPNNGKWWVKVEYPEGSGFYGWTGLQRFDESSFDLNNLLTEYWYDY